MWDVWFRRTRKQKSLHPASWDKLLQQYNDDYILVKFNNTANPMINKILYPPIIAIIKISKYSNYYQSI